eukprot:CAMPEP_0197437088 /NCGR_PEP_ID=MMETSP1175-20131217/4394_1 /TAXON_ID=1003142 /ORGANISM="Triceratium dubium, Strain CCMP147" /LENGTH=38 /DNA_ID= /DNA_START= /DNA_END= /DNA_ORIENTATION=
MMRFPTISFGSMASSAFMKVTTDDDDTDFDPNNNAGEE